MAENNHTILTKAYLAATNDYQQRIPDPTQSSISSTVKALFDPMNRKYQNQFMDILINRIGFTYVRGQAWTNKLAAFKGKKINYGSTIQEIAPQWIKAHSYEDDSETLLKMHRPEAEVWYHSQNRRDRYPISVTHDELRSAFVDEMGLNQLVAKIMQMPINSDEYDEYRIMMQLIAEYEKNWGFFKHNLSAFPTDEDTGKEFLTALRAYAGWLGFPSSLYNAADVDIPVFANRQELVLLMTPDADASVDVNTLSMLFNLEKGEAQIRKIIVDEFPIPDTVALLTTEDFFVCNDTLYENTSFWNPETLTTNYYLHHWGIYSVSPFVPAILFTTAEGTTNPVITQTVTGLTIEPATDEALPGENVEFTITLDGSISPVGTPIKVAPDAATYEIGIMSSAEEDAVPVAIKATTYIDEYGVLHLGKYLKSGNIITVTATSTYDNPSGETTEYTATATITVS